VNNRALRATVLCFAGLWAAVAAGAAATIAVPGAAGAARAALALHPGARAHPTLATVAALCVHNAVVALWPAALAATGVACVPVARRAFDACVTGSLVVNGGLVGTALAAYGLRLAPYLVQLPVEWAALAVGASVWFGARGRGGVGKGRLAALAAMLVVLAGLLEVYATPKA
jgi:hypothetical protein